MPTAQDILASGEKFIILFEADLDNTIRHASDYYDELGGLSAFGHQAGTGRFESNASVALSNGTVHSGLAHNVAMIGDVYMEKSLGEPFKNGSDYTVGAIEFQFTNEVLRLHLRDWVNKAFTVKIGYEFDDYADYELLFQGKTLGHTYTSDSLKVDLSTIPVGTNSLFPTETFTTGASAGSAIPVCFGRPKKIKPARVDENGLWRFHNDTVDTVDTIESVKPVSFSNWVDGYSLGLMGYGVWANNGFSSDANNATDAFPANTSASDGSVTNGADYLEVVLPDTIKTTGQEDSIEISYAVTDSTNALRYHIEIDCELDESSAINEFDILLEFIGGNIETKVRKEIKTIRSAEATTTTGSHNNVIFLQKAVADNGTVVQVNIHEVRVIFKQRSGAFVKAFQSDRTPIPTFKVADVSAVGEVPPYVALYDSNGYIKVNSANTSFVMDGLGDDTAPSAMTVMQEMMAAANSTSPIVSGITSDIVDYYASDQQPVITHIRNIATPYNLFLDFDPLTDNIAYLERYNRQANSFNPFSVANDLEAFTILEHQIVGDVTRLADEPTFSRYTVTYDRDNANDRNSTTVTDFDLAGHLDRELRIVGSSAGSAHATEIASLISRDAQRKPMYTFSIEGLGWDLALSSVGQVTHPDIEVGDFEIRKVREMITQNKTMVEGVMYV